MRRREFIKGSAALGVAGAAGCLDGAENPEEVDYKERVSAPEELSAQAAAVEEIIDRKITEEYSEEFERSSESYVEVKDAGYTTEVRNPGEVREREFELDEYEFEINLDAYDTDERSMEDFSAEAFEEFMPLISSQLYDHRRDFAKETPISGIKITIENENGRGIVDYSSSNNTEELLDAYREDIEKDNGELESAVRDNFFYWEN